MTTDDDYESDGYAPIWESPLGPEGCLFPGECCMPGDHYESECHTAEMLMAQETEEEQSQNEPHMNNIYLKSLEDLRTLVKDKLAIAEIPTGEDSNGELISELKGILDVLRFKIEACSAAHADTRVAQFTEADGNGIGWAVLQLKRGRKVRRSGWKGKGMYLWLLPEFNVPAEWCKEAHLKELAERSDTGKVHCLPSVRMKTATGEVLTGWLASQTDLLANDWELAEQPHVP